MSRKFILLFSSRSREENNFGLMFVENSQDRVNVGYVLVVDNDNIIVSKYPRT